MIHVEEGPERAAAGARRWARPDRPAGMTLRARLLALLVLVLLAAFAVAGTAVTLGVRASAWAQTEQAVTRSLAGVNLSGAGVDGQDARLGVWYRRLSEEALGLHTRGALILPDGRTYGTDSAPTDVDAGALARARQAGQAVSGDTRLTSTPGGTVLALDVPRAEVDALARHTALLFAGVGAATLLLAGVGAWWLLSLGLSPVRSMARRAEGLHPAGLADADLSARLPLPGPRDEVRSLAESVNRLLARLEDSVSRLRAEEARTRAFAADASHELRTPLAAITGSLEVLERAGDDPDVRERLHVTLRRETRRAARLVEDLLTLTRLDAGGGLRLEPLEPWPLLLETAEAARHLAPHLTLTVTADPDVRRARVNADRTRLEGAVWNLLRNAMTATPAGGTVHVALRSEGHALRVSVRNPARLSEALLARMFDRFARGPDAPPGGAGLGLAIVQATARAHGGDATATQHEHDLDVSVTLPRLE
ncbi:two-component system OmpR family sensor kinase [Deinococcus metalli]|uniref:histidine kinase n=1 Tax=Deinococcus metalli TaxID=1141878 RepID=A0A7W8KI66_9DEIO|nr:HAMP domain-containing sensor histidine kinase [Deinococcus metalli]MBB5378330.1 two-component system OmpR family sensor kinase [Deinococcus metalli]GHF59661.1 two-component sensor histidine kinase [Deinococcus metalli]